MRPVLAAIALLVAASSGAQPQPEECLARAGATAVTVEHNAKSYRLASEACREQFLSDPERYSQLYDALQELAAAGEKPPVASLVPS